ncbi:MAG: TIGR04255 family protein [Flavobacteriales bacterium]|nr:TIGR04255 family protein [Flavobacteriales bacterium]
MNLVSEPLPSAQPGRYRKPPVVEMIFSIRTAMPKPLDPAVFLEAVPNAFPDVFSEHKAMHTFQSQVMMKTDGTADHDTKSQLAGYRFIAPDSSFMAHYLVNCLTLNFLPPYSGYAPSLAVFKGHWALYKRLTGSAPVAGLVLRYIDRIDIPRDGAAIPLSDYFTIAPPTLGLKAHNCYLQYHLNDDAQDIRPEYLVLTGDQAGALVLRVGYRSNAGQQVYLMMMGFGPNSAVCTIGTPCSTKA